MIIETPPSKKVGHPIARIIAPVCLMLAKAVSASAGDVEWFNAAGGSFQIGLNWSTQSVPGLVGCVLLVGVLRRTSQP